MNSDERMKLEFAVLLAIVLVGLARLLAFAWHSLAALF
jgi:hypothetical protein